VEPVAEDCVSLLVDDIGDRRVPNAPVTRDDTLTERQKVDAGGRKGKLIEKTDAGTLMSCQCPPRLRRNSEPIDQLRRRLASSQKLEASHFGDYPHHDHGAFKTAKSLNPVAS
jgi:hypothetical protein